MTNMHKVADLDAQLRRDQQAILALKLGLTNADLDALIKTGTQEQKRVLLQRLLDIGGELAGAILNNVENASANAIKPMNIAGYDLPNGVGSLNSVNEKVIISRLPKGPGSAELAATIQSLGTFRNKTRTYQFMEQAAKSANQLKDTLGLLSSDNGVELAAAIVQVLAGLAGEAYGGPAAVFNATYLGSQDLLEAILLADAEKSLAKPIEGQLAALKVLCKKLERDVADSKRAQSALAVCKTVEESEWELYLKKLRLQAISKGNMFEYNGLVRQHAAIYKQLGYEPCESGLFPAGCLDKNGQTVLGGADVANSCLPVAANNVTEASWIENASNHPVCWARGDQGQLVAVGNFAPTQYKPQLTSSFRPASPGPIGSGNGSSSLPSNPAAAGTLSQPNQQSEKVGPQRLAGQWTILPGSWYIPWKENPRGAQRIANAGVDTIVQVASGHYQDTTLCGPPTMPSLDFSGSDERASADKDFVVNGRPGRDEYRIHSDVWLEGGKLYRTETMTRTFDPADKTWDRLQVTHCEAYEIAGR